MRLELQKHLNNIKVVLMVLEHVIYLIGFNKTSLKLI